MGLRMQSFRLVPFWLLAITACAGGDADVAQTPWIGQTVGTSLGTSSGSNGSTTGSVSSESGSDSGDPSPEDGETTGGCRPGSGGCPCTDEQTCDPGFVCSEQTCQEDDCPPDEFEPNDTLPQARALAGRTSFTANVGISADIADWYSFRVTPNGSSSPQSTLVTADFTAVAGARRCLVVECDQGNGWVVEDGCGALDYRSVKGLQGCCTNGDALWIDFYCYDSTPQAQDATLYLGTYFPEQECLDYSVQLDLSPGGT